MSPANDADSMRRNLRRAGVAGACLLAVILLFGIYTRFVEASDLKRWTSDRDTVGKCIGAPELMSTSFPICRSRFGGLGRRRWNRSSSRGFGNHLWLGLGWKFLDQSLTLAAQNTQNRPSTDQRSCNGKPIHGGLSIIDTMGEEDEMRNAASAFSLCISPAGKYSCDGNGGCFDSKNRLRQPNRRCIRLLELGDFPIAPTPLGTDKYPKPRLGPDGLQNFGNRLRIAAGGAIPG